MIKAFLIAFLTIIFQFNKYNALFAQSSQKENRKMALYSDTIEAIHYGIHLTDISQTNKTIKGYTKVKLVSKISNIKSIKLELASLTVDSVFVSGIRTKAFRHSGDQISIKPINHVNKGDTIQVVVYYHGHTFVDPSGWGGFHFSGDYALNLGVGFDAQPHNLGKAWFPCIDDFHDRALYDIYLTVPNNKKGISGGVLVEVTDQGNNTSTWHWRTEYTLPTYLISATTGKYELVSDSYNGVEDSIPITYYCRPSDTAKVAGTFINIKKILSVFENHLGPYPFERVGYTGTPGGLGAMEHASNISYPFSGWTGNTDREEWYAHELSHMWFGNKVTCASAEDMWLNEGWAVWCESLVREGISGKQAYKDYIRIKLKDVLQKTHITDGGYFALYGIPQTITYGSTVYQKGGQVVHTLRGYMGDSLFFNGIKAYLQKYAYNYATTHDLLNFLSSYSSSDLKPFFDAWIFTPGFPHFSVDSAVSVKSKSGYGVTVYVRQRLKGTTRYASGNKLEITFMSNKWEKITDTIMFSGVTGCKTFHLPFSPVEVMADMEEKISDATTDEYKTILKTGEYTFQQTFCKLIVEKITDSAMVRITHNWIQPDTLNLLQPGLRISDTRFWTVQGIFTEGFKAKGEFTYDGHFYPDNSRISDLKDSLVMLYRPGAGKTWKEIPFSQKGLWNEGTITVDNLERGEYSLALRTRH